VADRSLIDRALNAQEPTENAGVPGPIAKPAAAVFRGLSRLRGARAFHPDGVVFEAAVDVDNPPGDLVDVPLLGRPGSHRAVVRLSRALGLPPPVPDIHGFAIRFVDAYGVGRHQDFLTVTSLDGAIAHHVLLPTGGFFSLPFSTLLPYWMGDEVRLVGARPATDPVEGAESLGQLLATADERPVRFDVTLATLLGHWASIGTVTLGRRVRESQAQRIRFNPWNTGGNIRPTGPFMGLRESAYRESQRGWSADVS
jgi:hypothetical protein